MCEWTGPGYAEYSLLKDTLLECMAENTFGKNVMWAKSPFSYWNQDEVYHVKDHIIIRDFFPPIFMAVIEQRKTKDEHISSCSGHRPLGSKCLNNPHHQWICVEKKQHIWTALRTGQNAYKGIQGHIWGLIAQITFWYGLV